MMMTAVSAGSSDVAVDAGRPAVWLARPYSTPIHSPTTVRTIAPSAHRHSNDEQNQTWWERGGAENDGHENAGHVSGV